MWTARIGCKKSFTQNLHKINKYFIRNPRPGKRSFCRGGVFSLYKNYFASISSPSSLGKKRGHTFSHTVITDAASRVPISAASPSVFP